ncbi:hypothetical protein PENSUB_4283 [Penicillium subrubescens]|uniref:Uncharacterized protein n=1 Tax=Penicillium subrubescens TaxID=1316194 RepID=A0A1Q5UCT4_9EURO|nr:hypothetical protein PENSUB_4283 [Penicillium subrubescens]
MPLFLKLFGGAVGSGGAILSGATAGATTAAATLTTASGMAGAVVGSAVTGGTVSGIAAGAVGGTIAGGAASGAVTAVTSGAVSSGFWTGVTTASTFMGPAGLAYVGADGYTWDCWKPVVLDDSNGASNGIALRDLYSHPNIRRITVDCKGFIAENIRGGLFRLSPVEVEGTLAFHAYPV